MHAQGKNSLWNYFVNGKTYGKHVLDLNMCSIFSTTYFRTIFTPIKKSKNYAQEENVDLREKYPLLFPTRIHVKIYEDSQ
jgi:hypothetical protein